MGDRTTMLPDNHDEDWSHKANGIHRFPQEVRFLNAYIFPYTSLLLHRSHRIITRIMVYV